IDCGAYDGDTLLAAQAQGYGIENALCLEPDPKNFRKLVNTVQKAGISAICLPCAVGREASMLRFAAQGLDSSHLDPQGEVQVQAIGLDESFPLLSSLAPNLIKMDIEGAELEALEGASRLIQTYKPNMAIAVYHHFSHLWEIPLLLYKWLPDHRFYLQVHAYNSFEAVIYAQRQH
ncbi:MAG: FkbM family methyltransferase, partial [Betaproteobacteria bacterium]|nr:FkbM family methyltransferase [Betaproteobacteria bacterium]